MSNTKEPVRESPILVWVGLALVVLTMLAGLLLALAKWWRTAAKSLPVYGQVADFTLTNAFGAPVTLADLRGRVWVADIIFTRCAGPCPRMTRQMKQLQDALPPESEARLVTLTTDPDFDTPPILARYAERFGANSNRWMFLTGSKAQIGKVAIDSLKLTAIPKAPEERQSPNDLFVHSTIWVIVDKRGQLRGVFDTGGDGVDPREVQTKVLAAVTQLEREL